MDPPNHHGLHSDNAHGTGMDPPGGTAHRPHVGPPSMHSGISQYPPMDQPSLHSGTSQDPSIDTPKDTQPGLGHLSRPNEPAFRYHWLNFTAT